MHNATFSNKEIRDTVLSLASRPLRPTLRWNKDTIPSSTANYWLLDADTVLAQRCVMSSQEPTIPVFREPHVGVPGRVDQVLSEGDGDVHVWLLLDGTVKDRLACEFVPQNKLTVPKVGEHVVMYGLWRFDDEHGWFEIHPVDYWKYLP